MIRVTYLQAILGGPVLILSIQLLHLAVLVKAVIDVAAALHVQLQVGERLAAPRLEVYVDALDEVVRVALK